MVDHWGCCIAAIDAVTRASAVPRFGMKGGNTRRCRWVLVANGGVMKVHSCFLLFLLFELYSCICDCVFVLFLHFRFSYVLLVLGAREFFQNVPASLKGLNPAGTYDLKHFKSGL